MFFNKSYSWFIHRLSSKFYLVNIFKNTNKIKQNSIFIQINMLSHTISSDPLILSHIFIFNHYFWLFISTKFNTKIKYSSCNQIKITIPIFLYIFGSDQLQLGGYIKTNVTFNMYTNTTILNIIKLKNNNIKCTKPTYKTPQNHHNLSQRQICHLKSIFHHTLPIYPKLILNPF